ncbi:MAG TPA: hypothetical protein VGH74_02745 [Planctomycetaceae bacterium]|jgi:hypothetical protein
MRKAKKTSQKLSDAERVCLQRLRGQIDAEKGEILAEGRGHKAAHDAATGKASGSDEKGPSGSAPG